MALVLGAWSACRYDPQIDANGFACQGEGDCPSGYACIKAAAAPVGFCCNRADAASCAPSDGGWQAEVAAEAGVDAAKLDVGHDAPPVVRDAAPIDTAADVAAELPQADSPVETGAVDAAPVDAAIADLPARPDAAPEPVLDATSDVPPVDVAPVPPTVVSVSPTASAANVAPAAPVTATFSQALDAASVATGGMVLERGSTLVPSNVSVTGATVTLTPTQPLVLAGSYRVTIAATVKTAAGVALGADYAWTFTVRDGVFGPSKAISATGKPTDNLVLGANRRGDAMAAWQQVDEPVSGNAPVRTYAAGFSPATGWFAPALVDMADAASTNPAVAMSDDGSALVVFSTATAALSSRFLPSSGWSAPIAFAPSVLNLSLAMDAAGKGVAAYEQSGPVETKTFTAGAGWGAEQMLSGAAIFPQVAMAPSGTGVASFNGFLPTGGEQVSVARYTGTAWLAVEPLSSPTASVGNFSAATIDAAGTPLVMWTEGGIAVASRFVAGAWGAAQTVGLAPDGGEVIALSQEATDDIVAVTSTLSATAPGVVRANVLSGGTWGTQAKLNVDPSPITGAPAAAVAPNGNAIVIWIQGAALWASRFVVGAGWTPAQLVSDSAATARYGAPRVRSDGAGRLTIVFQRDDGPTARHVRAVRFE